MNTGIPQTSLARRGWLETHVGINNPQRCVATVVHRLPPSATAPTELFQIDVDAGAPREGLCALATALATTAEARLPPPT